MTKTAKNTGNLERERAPVRVRLDLRDKRILFELDRDCRQSNAEIGRKTRISEQSVAYRIARLQERGVIKSFYAVVDRSKLGCLYFRVFLKLQNIGAGAENKIVEYLADNPFVAWAAAVKGRWDIIFSVFVRNPDHLFQILEELTEKHGKYIAAKEITLGKVHAFTGMNILKESEVRTEGGGAAGAKRGEIVYGGTVTHEEIDELDEKILLALAADARARSKEIAAAVGVSLDTVRNRIRALKKKKILLGFRTVFSLKRIGLVYHDVVVELSHASFDVFKKIYAYCQERPEVCFVVRCIGDHELELEVATSSVEEFDEFTAQFRKAFAPDVREMESARIFHTAKINFYK